MRRLTILFFVLFAPPLGAVKPTEPGRPLSLFDATKQALEKNHDIAIVRDSFQIAGASLKRADGSYDPTFRLDARYRDHTDPVNSIFSGAVTPDLGPNYHDATGAASVSQLLPTGGSMALSLSTARNRNLNTLVPLSASYSTSLGIDLRQPLLQGLAIDPARRAIRVAKLEKDRSAASLKKTVADTVANVERAYWSLVAALRSASVAKKSVALAEEQKTNTKARIEAGALPESDLAQPLAEVERRRGELYAAEENAQQAELVLKTLVLGDPADPAWGETFVPSDEPDTPHRPVDLAEALSEAERSRPELKDAALTVARRDVELDAAKDRVKPQLDLVASYARRGLAGDTNPYFSSPFPIAAGVPPALSGGIGRSFGTVWDNEFPDASIGLALSIPIGNRAAKADAVIAGAQKRQALTALDQRKQLVAVEVRNAVLALETAAQRLEAAKAGRAAAETQLRAETDRYNVGLSTNFFVLTRQNELAAAELTETGALTDYRKAQTSLARSMGTLLTERNIRITDDTPAFGPEGGSR